MIERKFIRTGKVLKELGIGFTTVKDFLESRGFSDINPNTELDSRAYNLLLDEFQEGRTVEESLEKIVARGFMDILTRHGIHDMSFSVSDRLQTIPALILVVNRKASADEWYSLLIENDHTKLLEHFIRIMRSEIPDNVCPYLEKRIPARALKKLLRLPDEYELRSLGHTEFTDLFDQVLSLLGSMIGRGGDFFMQPAELTEFIGQFIPKKTGLKVYNPFAGMASFAQGLPEGASYFGQEISASVQALGQLRLMAHRLDHGARLRAEDSFLFWPSEQFDCILSFPPFGLLRGKDGNDWDDSPQTRVEGFLLEKAFQSLAYDGVAVLVVPVSLLFSESRPLVNLKRSLIEKGAMKWVIKMPSRIYANTGVNTAVIVLAKDGLADSSVGLVDATSCFKYQDAETRVLDVESLLTLLKDTPGDKVVKAEFDRLRKEHFNLEPGRYLLNLKDEEFDHPLLALGELLTQLRQRHNSSVGRLIRIRDLSLEPEAEIRTYEEVPEVKVLPAMTRVEGDGILIATVGMNLRPTLFSVDVNEHVVVNHSILAFRVNTELVVPAFLVHQLHQPYFTDQINALSAGSTIRSIKAKDLLSLKIEIPSIEQQLNRLKQYLRPSAGKKEYADKSEVEHLSAALRAQNEFLRHTIAGPLSNLKGSLLDLISIFDKEIAPKYPEVLAMKSHPLSELTARDYLNILTTQIDALDEKTRRTQRKDDYISSAKLSPVRLIAFLSEFVKTRNAGSSAQGYTLSFDYDEEKLQGDEVDKQKIILLGSESLLTEMLDNFLENAKKHGFDCYDVAGGHKFELYLRFEDDYSGCTLMITNTGKPLPEGFSLAVFEQQGASVGDSAGSGFGGHFISEVIRKHDGELAVSHNETEPDGLGGDYSVTFEIDFPLTPII